LTKKYAVSVMLTGSGIDADRGSERRPWMGATDDIFRELKRPAERCMLRRMSHAD